MVKAIKESQRDYLKLIQKYSSLFSHEKSSRINILYYLDEINIFWLKRLEIIEHELDNLVQENQCFILSGAVYLNTKEKEHYYFKTFGDYHILYDPFLKMEKVVRYNDELHDKTFRYLCNIYEDTIRILSDLNEEFFIIPINEIAWVSNNDDKDEIINNYFWKFISSIFSKEIKSEEEFNANYSDFYSIEKDLDQHILKNLIFTDSYDSSINLKERVERYSVETGHIIDLAKDKEEPEIFIKLVYIHIAQILDILLTASKVGLIPFIRYEVPFRYLCLLMGSFVGKQDIMDVIEKTMLFYLFYKSISVENFNNVSFELYCNTIRSVKFLDKVLFKIKELELDLMKTETNKIKGVILEEYKRLPIYNCL